MAMKIVSLKLVNAIDFSTRGSKGEICRPAATRGHAQTAGNLSPYVLGVAPKLRLSRNMLLLKNPHFLPDHYEIWSK